MVYTFSFIPLQNAVCFIILTYLCSCIIHILYTGRAKILKNNSGAKMLTVSLLLRSRNIPIANFDSVVSWVLSFEQTGVLLAVGIVWSDKEGLARVRCSIPFRGNNILSLRCLFRRAEAHQYSHSTSPVKYYLQVKAARTWTWRVLSF